jgi:hypothetical protein
MSMKIVSVGNMLRELRRLADETDQPLLREAADAIEMYSTRLRELEDEVESQELADGGEQPPGNEEP